MPRKVLYQKLASRPRGDPRSLRGGSSRALPLPPLPVGLGCSLPLPYTVRQVAKHLLDAPDHSFGRAGDHLGRIAAVVAVTVLGPL